MECARYGAIHPASVQRSSGWGLRGEPSPASLAKTPSFCSVEMFTKSSSSLVSAGWVPLSISVSEAHKMFMRKPCLEIEFRGALLSERGGRDAFEWRKTVVGIFPVSNACQYKSCQLVKSSAASSPIPTFFPHNLPDSPVSKMRFPVWGNLQLLVVLLSKKQPD